MRRYRAPNGKINGTSTRMTRAVGNRPTTRHTTSRLTRAKSGNLRAMSRALRNITRSRRRTISTRRRTSRNRMFRDAKDRNEINVTRGGTRNPTLSRRRRRPNDHTMTRLRSTTVPSTLPSTINTTNAIILTSVDYRNRARTFRKRNRRLTSLLANNLDNRNNTTRRISNVLRSSNASNEGKVLGTRQGTSVNRPPTIPHQRSAIFPNRVSTLRPNRRPPNTRRTTRRLTSGNNSNYTLRTRARQCSRRPIRPSIRRAKR